MCVAPDADYALYELWQRQLRGRDWEAFVISVTEVGDVEMPRVAAVVAHASDWPPGQVHAWLADIRRVVGPRKRLLALLPRPPASYPAETQALWTRALGYGAKISEAVAVVDDFIAGNI